MDVVPLYDNEFVPSAIRLRPRVQFWSSPMEGHLQLTIPFHNSLRLSDEESGEVVGEREVFRIPGLG
jgi:hypothetical protein